MTAAVDFPLPGLMGEPFPLPVHGLAGRVDFPLPGLAPAVVGLGGRFTFDLTQSDSLRALDYYMTTAEAKTPEAEKIAEDWILWYGQTSAFERNFDLSTYDKARTFRTRFLKANAVTPEEKALIARHLAEAITAEEAAGEARRMTREGEFPKVPPLIPDFEWPDVPQTKGLITAIAIAAAAIGLLVLATKAPNLSRIRPRTR